MVAARLLLAFPEGLVQSPAGTLVDCGLISWVLVVAIHRKIKLRGETSIEVEVKGTQICTRWRKLRGG